MAVVNATISTITGQGNLAGWKVTWASLANTSDTGSAVTFPDYSDRSIQTTGTFGGGAIQIEGTNDGSSFAPLTDPQGTVITAGTVTTLKSITEACITVRPKVVSSDGATTAINAIMFFRKTSQP